MSFELFGDFALLVERLTIGKENDFSLNEVVLFPQLLNMKTTTT